MYGNNKLRVIASVTCLLVIAIGFVNARAQNKQTARPEPICSVSPVQAIKAAIDKVPGRPISANFEFDEGKWVYGVLIVTGHTIKEVTVNPLTGKAEDVETVTPDGEAREIKAELNRAVGGRK